MFLYRDKGAIVSTTAYSVDGLHCHGCVDTVTRTLSTLPGVNSVTIDLDINGVSTVNVDAARTLPADEIQIALDREGNFTVV